MDEKSVPRGTDDDLGHLKSSRAWLLGVVGTVEELEALEAGAAELGGQIDDVADGLHADRRALIARVWPKMCDCDEPDGPCEACDEEHGHTCIICSVDFCTPCWETGAHNDDCKREVMPDGSIRDASSQTDVPGGTS